MSTAWIIFDDRCSPEDSWRQRLIIKKWMENNTGTGKPFGKFFKNPLVALRFFQLENGLVELSDKCLDPKDVGDKTTTTGYRLFDSLFRMVGVVSRSITDPEKEFLFILFTHGGDDGSRCTFSKLRRALKLLHSCAENETAPSVSIIVVASDVESVKLKELQLLTQKLNPTVSLLEIRNDSAMCFLAPSDGSKSGGSLQSIPEE